MVDMGNVEGEFLASFCSLALVMYPDLEWHDVEPKLARSWQRLHGDSGFGWPDVRESARVRWMRPV